MTVNTDAISVEYVGDGVTQNFVFTLKTFDAAWITATVDGVPTGVTVTLNANQQLNPGGSVLFIPAPVLDAEIVITRTSDLLQQTSYPVFGRFPAEDHESALDKLTIIAQQLTSGQDVIDSVLNELGTAAFKETVEVSDLDVLTESGFYTYNNSTTGAPSIMGGALTHYELGTAGFDGHIQIATTYNSEIWARTYDSGMWQPWQPSSGGSIFPIDAVNIAFDETLTPFAAGTLQDALDECGTAAVATLQTSTLDDTSGAVLTVGAFGLGTSNALHLDGDNIEETGFYRYLQSWPSNPDPATPGVFIHNSYSAGTRMQLAITQANDVFTRVSIGGTYGAWNEVGATPSNVVLTDPAGVQTIEAAAGEIGLAINRTPATGDALFVLSAAGTPVFEAFGDGDLTIAGQLNAASMDIASLTGLNNLLIDGSFATGGVALPAALNAGGIIQSLTDAGTGLFYRTLFDTTAHGMTSIAPTDCNMQMLQGANNGGVQMQSLGGLGMALLAYASTTTSTPGLFAAFEVQVGVASGVSVAQVPDTDFAVAFRNSASTLLSILGNGDTSIVGDLDVGGSITGTFAFDDLELGGYLSTGGVGAIPGVSNTGGISINQTLLADGVTLAASAGDLNHGMTTVLPTDVFFAVAPVPPDGGASIIAAGGDGYAMSFEGFVVSPFPGGASLNDGVLKFVARAKNGTGFQSLANDERVFSIHNDATPLVNVFGNGDAMLAGDVIIAGGLSTGDEPASDVGAGGLCVKTASSSDNAQTWKSAIAHPFTGVAEADTYGAVKPVSSTNGGVRFQGYAASTAQAVRFIGHTQSPSTSNSVNGVVEFFARKSDGGTSFSSLASDENLATFSNNGAIVEVTKGNGDKYLDGGIAVGGGTDLLKVYDEGTWTVEFYDAASGGNVSPTITTGSYIQIGNVVHINFVSANNIDTTGMTGGNILFFTLPVVSASTTSGALQLGSVNADTVALPAGRTQINCGPFNNNSSRGVLIACGSSVSDVQLTVGALTSGVSDIPRLSMSYFTG